MRIVVVIQAREGSSRLPGKVLREVAGAPLLIRMLERVRAAREPDEVVVAVPAGAADDAVARCARDAGVAVTRGHPTDCLDRHRAAGVEHHADVVVKIPSDCPLVDPRVIDRVLGEFRARPDDFDFLSNLHPPTWPDGNDVEAMTRDALETAWREAAEPHEREHTTPFLWDHPDRFRVGNVVWDTGRDLSLSHRFTVDYPEDLDLVRGVFDELYDPGAAPFSVEDVVELLRSRPDLYAVNLRYAGVNWYRTCLDRLRTVDASHTRDPEEMPT